MFLFFEGKQGTIVAVILILKARKKYNNKLELYFVHFLFSCLLCLIWFWSVKWSNCPYVTGVIPNWSYLCFYQLCDTTLLAVFNLQITLNLNHYLRTLKFSFLNKLFEDLTKNSCSFPRKSSFSIWNLIHPSILKWRKI